MSELMRIEGLPYGDRAMTFNSRLAQELAAWADARVDGPSLHDALFQAYFVRGRNVGREDELLAIVEEAGLPVDEAKTVLASRSFRNVVDADWQESRSLGITSVPTFVVGNRAAVGAQPFETLEQLVVQAGATRRR